MGYLPRNTNEGAVSLHQEALCNLYFLARLSLALHWAMNIQRRYRRCSCDCALELQIEVENGEGLLLNVPRVVIVLEPKTERRRCSGFGESVIASLRYIKGLI